MLGCHYIIAGASRVPRYDPSLSEGPRNPLRLLPRHRHVVRSRAGADDAPARELSVDRVEQAGSLVQRAQGPAEGVGDSGAVVGARVAALDRAELVHRVEEAQLVPERAGV